MSKKIKITLQDGDAQVQTEVTRKELMAILADGGNRKGVPRSAAQVQDVNWWYQGEGDERRIASFLVRTGLDASKQAVTAVRTFFDGLLVAEPDALACLKVRNRRDYQKSEDRVDEVRRELITLVVGGLMTVANDPTAVEGVVASKQDEVEAFLQRYVA